LKGTGAFVVDELTLLEQTRRALIEVLGEKVGVVGRSEFKPHRITVATIQTLHKHRHKPAFKKWFPNIDVLIVDEVHLALNKRNLDVIQQIRPKATFGLTATLQIEKPEVRIPAIALTGPVIFEYPLQDGVEEGYLSRGVVGSISFYDPLRGQAPGYRSYSGKEHVWVPSGSKPAEYRYHVCLNKARNDCIESLVRQALKIKRRVIVLVEQKIHLRILSQRMKDVHHEALCGDVDTDTRFHAMREMDLGKLNLILASRVFAKGVDVRSVDLIIDATGLPSRNNAIQRYGRGARKAEGKKGLIFLSIADRGNRFEMAGRLREGALRETGTPILQFDWKKNPEEILSRCRVGEVLSSGDRNDPYRVTSDCMPVGHLRYSSSPSITSR
jgi:superfamily II DNA or RNA helicase